jgi:hypothetical protein
VGWPLSQDYNEAIQDPRQSFTDPELRGGQPAVNALGLPMPRSGNFADVYQVHCPASGSCWAVKCFTREVPGLQDRYGAIGRHLAQARLPFTVDFLYLEQGIRVRGGWHPVVKMRWVEGLLLNEFVRGALDKPAALQALAQVWLRMAQRLREAQVAHGDLQHGNVLLVPGSTAGALALKLIDYDGMYVPALAQSRSGEVGHPSYQHPQRLREGTYGPEVDHFAVLLVYIAIRALMVGGRALWDRYDNGDGLLFREEDLRSPRESALFNELWHLSGAAVHALAGHVALASVAPAEQVPLLEQLLAGEMVQPLTAVQEGRAADLLGPRVPIPQPPPLPPPAPALPSPEVRFDVPSPVRVTRPGRARKRRSQDRPHPWLRGMMVASLLGMVVGALGIGGAALLLMIGMGPGMAAKLPELVRGRYADTGHDHTQPMQGQGGAAEHEQEGAKPAADSRPVQDPPAHPAAEGQADAGEVRRVAWGGPAALTPDGKLFFGVGSEGVAVWPSSDADAVLQPTKGTANASCLAIDPTSRYAAVGTADGHIDVWDLKERVKEETLPGSAPAGGGTAVSAVAFSPDGTRLVSASLDYSIRLWNWGRGQEVGRMDAHDNSTGKPQSLAFSPNGQFLVVGDSRGNARVIRVEGNQEVGTYHVHRRGVGPVASMVVAPDNRRVVSAGHDGTARVWELLTGKELVVFDRHAGRVLAVAVSPDGHCVLSAGDDGVVRLWDLDDGREVYHFTGRADPLGFFPDGRHAFAGGADRALHVWRLPPAHAR